MKKSAFLEFVRQVLLTEEVFGAQAFVYHGTTAKPEIFIKALINDEFIAGGGAGSMYGDGLYTVYDLQNSATERGNYGDNIIKLKVNLNGFLIFDKDVATKVYGKPLTAEEQAKNLGLSEEILDTIFNQEMTKPEYTSDIARPISRDVEGKVKGLVFTGRQDGKVALIYDPGVVIPFAYKEAGDLKWTQVDRKSLGPAVSRSASGEWEQDKFDQRKLLKKMMDLPPTKQQIGSLNLKNYPEITELPDSLKVIGDLDIRKSNLKSIPENLRVTGDFYLDGQHVDMLPRGFRCWGGMMIDGIFDSMPEDLTIEGDLNMPYVKSGKLPAGNMTVRGNMYMPYDKNSDFYKNFRWPENLMLKGEMFSFALPKSQIPPHYKKYVP